MMRSTNRALVVVALALVVGHAAASRSLRQEPGGEMLLVPEPGPREFDYFMFVRQWPGTFCTSHACPLLKHRDWYRFTIHGLWPNYNDGTWPQFCDKDLPFDEDELADILPELEDSWPSFMDSSSDENFWAHEWNKHGTCCLRQLPSEHKFFKTVLKLHFKYDIKSALAAAGIQPSSRRKYPKQDILDALEDAYGVNAMLHCTADGQLTEVWMCFDKELSPMKCNVPASDASHCSEISMLPLPGGSPTKVSDGWLALRDDSSDAEPSKEGKEGGDEEAEGEDEEKAGEDKGDEEEQKAAKKAEKERKKAAKKAAKEEKKHKHEEDEEEREDDDDEEAHANSMPCPHHAKHGSKDEALLPHMSALGQPLIGPQPGGVRTLLIAATGGVLAAIVLLTLAASWATRRDAVSGLAGKLQMGLEHRKVLMRAASATPATEPADGSELVQPLLAQAARPQV